MKEADRIVNDILTLSKNYGDLYKAAGDLVKHWEGYKMESKRSAIAWLEIIEGHVLKIAAILEEQKA